MIWKRAGDVFLAGVDFATWPIQPGESLVTSNARGTLSVAVKDLSGNDVTGDAIVGSPSIDGTKVVFMLGAGVAAGSYKIMVAAPTSDDELLTETVGLRVK